MGNEPIANRPRRTAEARMPPAVEGWLAEIDILERTKRPSRAGRCRFPTTTWDAGVTSGSRTKTRSSQRAGAGLAITGAAIGLDAMLSPTLARRTGGLKSAILRQAVADALADDHHPVNQRSLALLPPTFVSTDQPDAPNRPPGDQSSGTAGQSPSNDRSAACPPSCPPSRRPRVCRDTWP